MINKKLFLLSIFIMGLLSISSIAGAIPIADLVYVETALGGGWYRYNYTAYNTSTNGEPLFDFGFWFDEDATFEWLSLLPTGWVESGPYMIGFEEAWSTHIDYDIPAGGSLGGFVFKIDYQAGDVEFDAYFDRTEMLGYTGVTRPIPEPSTLILLGSGLSALAYFRIRLRKKY